MVTQANDPRTERGTVTFLANRAESLSFWASIAGLILVLTVTAASLFSPGVDASAADEAERRIEALEARMADQADEIARLRAEVDSLRTR